MRVGFFSQWYEPEPGPAALTSETARALAERGHEVAAFFVDNTTTNVEGLLADIPRNQRRSFFRRTGVDSHA